MCIMAHHRKVSSLYVPLFAALFFCACQFSRPNAALFLCLAALYALRHRYATGLLCVGVAALFRPSALVFALAWPAFLLGRSWREWLGCALALAGGLLGLGLYNILRYGSLLQSGYAGASYFTAQIDGLIGFIISPGRALWIFAPLMLLLIPALLRAIKMRDLFVLRLLPGLLAYYVLHAMWHEWHGGWSYGPRLLIPILPLLVILLAPYLLRRAALPLILAGLGIQLLSLFANPYSAIEHALMSGTTFEQTVWSLQANLLVLQAQAVWAEISLPRLALIVAAGTALTALYGYARAVQAWRPVRSPTANPHLQ
jgi:hypothetical protein